MDPNTNEVGITEKDLASTIHKVVQQTTAPPGRQALSNVVEQLGTRLKGIHGGKFDTANWATSCGITEEYKKAAA